MSSSITGLIWTVLLISVLVGCGTSESSQIHDGRTLIVRLESGGKPILNIKPNAIIYADAKQILDTALDVEDNGIFFVVGRRTYDELHALFNSLRDESELKDIEAAQQRWRAQDDHWDNILAINQIIDEVWGDMDNSLKDTQLVCHLAPNWKDQHDAALQYVRDYRRDDPDLVKQSGIPNLEAKILQRSKLVGIPVGRMRRIKYECIAHCLH